MTVLEQINNYLMEEENYAIEIAKKYGAKKISYGRFVLTFDDKPIQYGPEFLDI